MADGVAHPEPGAAPRLLSKQLLAAFGAVLLLLGAVVAAVLLLVGKKPLWSDWQPKSSNDPNVVVSQITHHVAPRYRLQNGVTLAGSVLAGRPLLGNDQITAIVLDPGTGSQRLVAQPTPTDTIQYTFCGSGPVCSLPKSTSGVRAAAENEALELVLYTFKYVPVINTVIVLLPPPLGTPTDHALVVTRADARSALDHPLEDTLGWASPPAADRVSSALVAKIRRNATPHIFRYENGRDPTGRVVMAIYSS
jgi:hypothetical protein